MSDAVFFGVGAGLVALLGLSYSLGAGLREREKAAQAETPSSVPATRRRQARSQRQLATQYTLIATTAWLVAIPCLVTLLNLLLDISRSKEFSPSRLVAGASFGVWIIMAVAVTRRASRHRRDQRFN